MAGEYEIKNAQAMKILDSFGAGGSFTEYYAIDFKDDVILMGHDGPGHIAIAQGKTKVRPSRVYHGKVGRGLSVEMSVKHGPVTLLSVVQTVDRRLKLLDADAILTPDRSWRSATPTAATVSRWRKIIHECMERRRTCPSLCGRYWPHIEEVAETRSIPGNRMHRHGLNPASPHAIRSGAHSAMHPSSSIPGLGGSSSPIRRRKRDVPEIRCGLGEFHGNLRRSHPVVLHVDHAALLLFPAVGVLHEESLLRCHQTS